MVRTAYLSACKPQTPKSCTKPHPTNQPQPPTNFTNRSWVSSSARPSTARHCTASCTSSRACSWRRTCSRSRARCSRWTSRSRPTSSGTKRWVAGWSRVRALVGAVGVSAGPGFACMCSSHWLRRTGLLGLEGQQWGSLYFGVSGGGGCGSAMCAVRACVCRLSKHTMLMQTCLASCCVPDDVNLNA